MYGCMGVAQMFAKKHIDKIPKFHSLKLQHKPLPWSVSNLTANHFVCQIFPFKVAQTESGCQSACVRSVKAATSLTPVSRWCYITINMTPLPV